MRRVWWIAVLVGCGPAVSVPGEAETEGTPTSSTTSSDPSSPSTTPTTMTGVPPSMTVGTTIDDTSDGSSSDTGSLTNFIVDPDGSVCSCECSVWDQDCPRGEKCMPWANDGGVAWNATRCSPIDPDPAGVGEPCTVVENGVSGIDDCELGSMCWNVDPKTLEGTCIGFCTGSENAPVCPADHICNMSNEGVLILCLPTCDPVMPACGDTEVCIIQEDGFVCVPGTGGESGYGDPCTNSWDCVAGQWCISGPDVAGIGACTEADAGCCTAMCHTDGAACPDAALGQTCVPLYEPGEAPPGYETLGVCALE